VFVGDRDDVVACTMLKCFARTREVFYRSCSLRITSALCALRPRLQKPVPARGVWLHLRKLGSGHVDAVSMLPPDYGEACVSQPKI
jgi:hypothetical protein